MPTYGGNNVNGKIIKLKPYEEEGEDKLLWLTDRQRGLLLGMTEYLDWKTRWASLPSPLDDDDYRDSYVANLKDRLMLMVEFCSQVIDCLKNDKDTKDALSDIINLLLGGAGTVTPGQPLTEEQFQHDYVEGTNPTCDPVIVGRQCNAFIQFWNRANHDLLEKIAVAENVLELAEQIAGLPGVNLIADQAGITSAFNFIEYMVNAIKEQYEAGDTDEKMKDLALQLWCLCKDDCQITLERFFQMTAENINGLIPKSFTEAITTLNQILETLFGIDVEGELTVDLIFWLNGVLAKVVSMVTFKMADRALAFLLNSAKGDATYDLDTSGYDCPAECFDEFDFEIDNGDWASSNRDGQWKATYVEGEGWRFTQGDYPGSVIQFEIYKAYTDKTLTSIRLFWEVSDIGSVARNIGAFDADYPFTTYETIFSSASLGWTLTPGSGNNTATLLHLMQNGNIYINANFYFVDDGATFTLKKAIIGYEC